MHEFLVTYIHILATDWFSHLFHIKHFDCHSRKSTGGTNIFNDGSVPFKCRSTSGLWSGQWGSMHNTWTLELTHLKLKTVCFLQWQVNMSAINYILKKNNNLLPSHCQWTWCTADILTRLSKKFTGVLIIDASPLKEILLLCMLALGHLMELSHH